MQFRFKRYIDRAKKKKNKEPANLVIPCGKQGLLLIISRTMSSPSRRLDDFSSAFNASSKDAVSADMMGGCKISLVSTASNCNHFIRSLLTFFWTITQYLMHRFLVNCFMFSQNSTFLWSKTRPERDPEKSVKAKFKLAFQRPEVIEYASLKASALGPGQLKSPVRLPAFAIAAACRDIPVRVARAVPWALKPRIDPLRQVSRPCSRGAGPVAWPYG